jgi:hypothetical protein
VCLVPPQRMQDRNSVPKRLGPGQNVLCPAINRSINQSCVNQSINHPDPAHQSISRFRAPAARFCKSDVMGCCLAHVSPTLHKHMENMGGGGPHTRCPASCSRDSCIDGIPGTPAARQSRSDASQIYEKRKVKVLLVSNPPSPRPQDRIRIQMYPDTCITPLSRWRDAMTPRSS